MVNQTELSVAPRSVLGKKVKGLRRQGITPANVYGHHLESQALEIDTVMLARTLRSLESNAIVSLRIEGEKAPRPVIVRTVQRDLVTDKILHVDFYQVSLAEKMKAEVPLVVVGKAPAVVDLGGILLQGLDRITVEALPGDIPGHVEVDISNLTTFDSSVHVRDLVIDPKVHLMTDPDMAVASVAAPRVTAEAEEAEAAEEEGAAEGEREEGPAAAEEEKEEE